MIRNIAVAAMLGASLGIAAPAEAGASLELKPPTAP